MSKQIKVGDFVLIHFNDIERVRDECKHFQNTIHQVTSSQTSWSTFIQVKGCAWNFDSTQVKKITKTPRGNILC